MLRSKTVFIIGAGASCEVGLPAGAKLKEHIATHLNIRYQNGYKLTSGDRSIVETMNRKHTQLFSGLQSTCWRIAEGLVLSSSIDDFIDIHQEDQAVAQCAKLAIVRSILDAEARSLLYFDKRRPDDTIRFNNLEKSWYLAFYDLLFQGVKTGDLRSAFENATIICFNYDRCLEHFLPYAIALQYNLGVEQVVRDLMPTLKIFHPYGLVGPCFGESAVLYGQEGMPDFDSVMESIRTYTERVEDADILDAMQEAIKQAGMLVFLGNAYHENNMRLLGNLSRTPKAKSKTVYFTRQGIISDADLVLVKERLSRVCGALPQLNAAGSCFDVFDQYRLSLRG